MSNSSHLSSIDKLLPALHHALSGSAGTLISTCATYPLSLVVTRLQIQRQLARTGRLAAADEYAGIVDAFSRIWRDGDESAASAATPRSIAALYTGLTTELAKSVLDSFLFFLFYELFKSRSLLRRRLAATQSSGTFRGVIEELAVGIAAGACSRAFTTPIANVVTRKQTGAMVDGGGTEARQLSVREIINSILSEKGVAGLWSGYSATLVLTLNPGITFFLQDFLKRTLLGDDRRDDPGAALTFLLAASSKAIASAIMYPFQTAKARLQSGVPVHSIPEQDETGEQEKEQQQTQQKAAESHDPGNGDRAIDREVDAKLRAARAVQKLAKQSVFSTIRQIARTEGVGALYDGIHGELLKGFFSHGTTMLAKGTVHKLFFKLYLVVASLLQELRARRMQSSVQSRPGQQYERTLRALSFKDMKSHGETKASHKAEGSSKLASSVPRLTSTRHRTDSTERQRSSGSIILNFQDRTHRGLDQY